MKDELIRKILVELNKNFQFDIYEVESILTFIFGEYEVTKKETSIVPLSDSESSGVLLQNFLLTKMTSGRSKKTLQYYKLVLTNAFTKINKNVVDITSDDIKYYLAEKQYVDGVTSVTANNERRVLNSFFEWLCVDAEKIPKNPIKKIENIKEKKSQKKAFTEFEVERMRLCCKTPKEKAIFELLLSTACRASELVSIRIDSIKGDCVTVLGKGNKERLVILNARSQIALKTYLDTRSDTNPYLFPMKSSTNCMSTSNLQRIVKEIGKRADIENVHPHRFRRTAATMALKHGMPVEQVSKMLGHSQLTTTQIYLDLSEDMLREAHKKYLGG